MTPEDRALNGLIRYAGNVSYIYELLGKLKSELESNDFDLPDVCYDLIEMSRQDASAFFKSVSNLVTDGILKTKE